MSLFITILGSAALIDMMRTIVLMLVGSFYSIPQTRFKTRPFIASFSISFMASPHFAQ